MAVLLEGALGVTATFSLKGALKAPLKSFEYGNGARPQGALGVPFVKAPFLNWRQWERGVLSIAINVSDIENTVREKYEL